MADFTVFSKATCKWCDKAKALLTEKGYSYREVLIDESPEDGVFIRKFCANRGVRPTVPQIFEGDGVAGEWIGGHDALVDFLSC